MKYYGIKGDNYKNIVNDWEEAKKIIGEIKNPKYKSFLSEEEAEAFINDVELSDGITEPKCYIDGSFNQDTNEYSFGGVLIINDKEYTFNKKFDKDEYSEFRNVAGEIKGASFIINYCIKNGINKLHLFYDYEGIEAWFTNRWNQNTLISKKYAEFRDTVKDKIEVVFHKVKGHSNNHYNDLADKLAKEALGIK